MPIKTLRNKNPLLVIGIGGTGKDVVLKIKQSFSEQFNNPAQKTFTFRKTAFLVMDSDNSEINSNSENITEDELCDLQVFGVDRIFRQQSFTKEEFAWVNRNISPVAIMVGAGGIRQVGRLMLFRNIHNVLGKLQILLNRILETDVDNPPEYFSLNVIICGSLCGGTGSGIALDLAYIIRQLISDHYPLYIDRLKIYGIFIMPECIIQCKNLEKDVILSRKLKENSFEARKEIDYWMHQEEHKDILTVRYPGFETQRNTYPYNFLFYLNHTKENNLPNKKAYETAKTKTVEFALFLSTETPMQYMNNSICYNLLKSEWEMKQYSDADIYPVSARIMDFEACELPSFLKGLQNYEKQTVLCKVLNVPLFDPDDSDLMRPITESDARINGKEQVFGSLGFVPVQEAFFDALKIDIITEDVFVTETTPTPVPIATLLAMGGGKIEDYNPGKIHEYCKELQSIAKGYYEDYYRRLLCNFGIEARKAITDINCGPAAFIQFLDSVYIPDVTMALEEVRARSEDGAYESCSCAEAAYDSYKDIMRFHILPNAQIACIERYRSSLMEYFDAEWNWRRMIEKEPFLSDYLSKTKQYRDELSKIIEAIKQQVESIESTTDNGQDESSWLSVDQIRKYLKEKKLPDANVEKAKDQILKEIADLCDNFLSAFITVNPTQNQIHGISEEQIGTLNHRINSIINTYFENEKT